MKKTLWQEFARNALTSLGIYAALFLILYIAELLVPNWQGALLRWNDADFLVGIPASLVGTAYVLTIRNPKNYTGFYGGILLNILLAVQFALQGNLDLVILHTVFFLPFQISALIRWHKQALQPTEDNTPFKPQWLNAKWLVFSFLFFLLVVAADYALITKVIAKNAWQADWAIKIFSGGMVAASILSNFLMIYKKIDAWLWWVVYSLAGMVLYALMGNVFSFVLFTMFLIVNGGVGVIWFRLSKKH